MRVGMVASARQCLATSGAIPSRERGARIFRPVYILRLRQIDIEDLAIQKENSCGRRAATCRSVARLVKEVSISEGTHRTRVPGGGWKRTRHRTQTQ